MGVYVGSIDHKLWVIFIFGQTLSWVWNVLRSSVLNFWETLDQPPEQRTTPKEFSSMANKNEPSLGLSHLRPDVTCGYLKDDSILWPSRTDNFACRMIIWKYRCKYVLVRGVAREHFSLDGRGSVAAVNCFQNDQPLDESIRKIRHGYWRHLQTLT